MQVRTRRGFLGASAAIAVASSVGACGARRGGAPQATDPLDVSATANLPAARESLAADGTTIVIGNPSAPLSVRVYEDLSCPACADFELAGNGPYLKQAARNDALQLQFTLGSFLGPGSKFAANALRAAVDHNRFAKYHEVLYRHQAKVRKAGGFTRDRLLTLAVKVPGLRGPEFDAAVLETKHRDFVEAADEAMAASPAEGTPTMAVNGVPVPTDSRGLYDDRDRLYRHLRKAAARS
ncbi:MULTISPECIES: thioredoxin domain-containing protein [unclassified Streptomyces]|uniref:DsbA family protein n=1 Tax=unclassified Streptomyces TaxID=2593676 RepID=UPI000451B0FF|nr:thioredoxin domain-containing protein [Streptomyces sp. PCS3-D2]WKV75791.1 DsbA family protein [Streptomyces sp. PCS3-D2]